MIQNDYLFIYINNGKALLKYSMPLIMTLIYQIIQIKVRQILFKILNETEQRQQQDQPGQQTLRRYQMIYQYQRQRNDGPNFKGTKLSAFTSSKKNSRIQPEQNEVQQQNKNQISSQLQRGQGSNQPYRPPQFNLTYPEPFYRKCWFWTIVILLLLAGIGTGAYFFMRSHNYSCNFLSTGGTNSNTQLKGTGQTAASTPPEANINQTIKQSTTASAATSAITSATTKNQTQVDKTATSATSPTTSPSQAQAASLKKNEAVITQTSNQNKNNNISLAEVPAEVAPATLNSAEASKPALNAQATSPTSFPPTASTTSTTSDIPTTSSASAAQISYAENSNLSYKPFTETSEQVIGPTVSKNEVVTQGHTAAMLSTNSLHQLKQQNHRLRGSQTHASLINKDHTSLRKYD